MKDQEVVCVECAHKFVWTVKTQTKMEELLEHGEIKEIIAPKRCFTCRTKRREKYETIRKAQEEIDLL